MEDGQVYKHVEELTEDGQKYEHNKLFKEQCGIEHETITVVSLLLCSYLEVTYSYRSIRLTERCVRLFLNDGEFPICIAVSVRRSFVFVFFLFFNLR